MPEKISFEIKGTVSGFKREDESSDEAMARLALEAEMYGNSKGNPRIHIQLTEIDGEVI